MPFASRGCLGRMKESTPIEPEPSLVGCEMATRSNLHKWTAVINTPKTGTGQIELGGRC